MGLRLLLAVAVATLLLVGALLAWVLLSNRPREFDVPLATGRLRPQGDFYVCPLPEPRDLNPFTTTDPVARRYVLRFTHDCLMRLDPSDGSLQPMLVSVVDSSGDGWRYDFELRDGAVFADGTAVTVEDVAFTYEVSTDREVALGSLRDCVDRIRKFTPLGDRRFRIELRTRHFTGLAGLATGYVVVQKRWFLDAVAQQAEAAGAPVPAGPGVAGFARALSAVRFAGPGSGPYQIAVDRDGQRVWEHGKDLWLVQNPHAWHRAAFPGSWNLAGLQLRFIHDPQAQFTALRKQQLDFHMATDLAALLRQNPDLLEHYRSLQYSTPALGQFLVVWNHDRPALANASVRRALTMLFDRQRIVDDVFGGSAQVARCWFKPGTLEYTPDLEPIAFDIQAARKLLAEAGYGPGQAGGPLQLSILAPNDPRYARMLEIAAPAFRSAGVELTEQLHEWGVVQSKAAARLFDGRMILWSHDATGVDPFEFFHSSPAGQADSRNPMHYADAEVDALLTAARVELDGAARRVLYHRFNRLIHRDQPVTLMVHPINSLLLHKRFQAARPEWIGIFPEKWWVAPADRLHKRGTGR